MIPSRSSRRTALLAAVATLSLVTACGSTVQQQGQVSSLGDGLSSPQGQVLPGTATDGPAAPGALPTSSGPGGAPAAVGTAGGPVTAVPGGTSPTAGSSAPGAAVGTSTDRSPIEVGFVTTSVGNAQALGFNPGSTYTDRALFGALVKEYNAAGGLAGRKIVPVYGDTDTASTNWANDFAAACATFTQDHRVKVVVGYVFVFLKDFESCLAKAGVPHLYGGYQPGDVQDQKLFSTLVATGHPTVDGYYLTALEGGLASGVLTKKTRLGLIVDDCADGYRAYDKTVEPWLKSHGITYETVKGACSSGASDVGGASSAVSNAALRFAADRVDLVLANPVVVLLFMQAAQSQGYTPQYLTGTGGGALQANAPANQLKNLHGFGWMPVVDVSLSKQPLPQSASQKACLAKLARQGLKPTAFNDFMAAYQACDGLDLYAKALASAGTTAAAPIVSSIAAALPSFAASGTYGGGVRYADTQRGGGATAREYAWDDGCSCLTYRGRTFPVVSP